MYPRIPPLEARLPRLRDRLRFRLRSLFYLTIACSLAMALAREANLNARVADFFIGALALLLVAAWAGLIGWIVYRAACPGD